MRSRSYITAKNRVKNSHIDEAYTVSMDLGSVLNLEECTRIRKDYPFRILYMGTKEKKIYTHLVLTNGLSIKRE